MNPLWGRSMSPVNNIYPFLIRQLAENADDTHFGFFLFLMRLNAVRTSCRLSRVAVFELLELVEGLVGENFEYIEVVKVFTDV